MRDDSEAASGSAGGGGMSSVTEFRRPYRPSWYRRPSVLAALILLTLGGYLYRHFQRAGLERLHIFAGLEGPAYTTRLPEPEPTAVARYAGAGAGTNRMAVLLTATNCAWLGLAHGLKTIGVPFVVMTNWQEAVRHRVVFVYPLVSGKVLSPDALDGLQRHAASGGTLIGGNVLVAGMNRVFGFGECRPANNRFEIRVDAARVPALGLGDPREQVLRLGDRTRASTLFETQGYTQPAEAPVATFEDGLAALTRHRHGAGWACALGLDLGAFTLQAHNSRLGTAARSYVNEYEPALDVLWRIIRHLYEADNTAGLTLGTVPEGRQLAFLITHDVDYANSVKNALAYAEYEHGAGLPATYFIQTKYLKDFNDRAFLDETAAAVLRKLAELGMELASHSVSHSKAFWTFPMGDGQERYPGYRPLVQGAGTNATAGGSVLGELRVSKFLIEGLVPSVNVVAWRSGHLANPDLLPQALAATGYRFSSDATANVSLTHLPFQLNRDHGVSEELEVFEFPVTVEDELALPLLNRLPAAVALAERVASYGGAFVLLIHPNVVGGKLEFERRLIEATRSRAWFGSVTGFGRWWAARNAVELDASEQDDRLTVHLRAPARIRGLPLRVPTGWTLVAQEPASVNVRARDGEAIVGDLQGDATLVFARRVQ